MFRDLKWKIPLIFAVLLGAVWLAYPVDEKINLGLDLQGGMHLVLEVQTEKAVESALEQRADDIKRALQDEDIELERVFALQEDMTVHIILVDTIDAPTTTEAVKSYPNMKLLGTERDGLELIYQVTPEEIKFIKENAVQQALETIRNRVDQFGVSEPAIQVQGERRILVQLPGIEEPERAINLIGKTARLEFKAVDESMSPQQALNEGAPMGSEVLYQRIENEETGEVTKEPYLIKERPIMTGDTLTAAEVRFDNQFNEPYVALTFNSLGGQQFYQLSKDHLGKRVAIVLDNNVYSAPVIREEIPGGRAQITGRFTTNEARDLAIALRAGALPAPVIILENRTIGPSLGRDSVEAGVTSIAAGFVMVLIFMMIYYRLSGVIAVTALFLNLVLLLGALAYFGASLTLPGIAGIILTVGMAVDANVLVFERIREEIRIGKPVRAAIEAGFAKALSTIVDANVTTFIAAIVLFQFGTGPIKGFAITLCIGIAASMFTAVFVSRTVFDSAMARKKINTLSIG
ncbi:Protein-export membrane protein SecD [Nitrospina gracilis 3/211]|uniref:Protein translocase subunit SecD n=1 Tax=Nitrospina gracilis (strain 3/211) TaxID=1266370 RepID=M1YZQ2_NITG3|nr:MULTISPECIES: protein translocase subunit SecD [Nitrospina]MCF8723863.1 preprotein translocase subunit SecD [Nitrospina sp. Nb-3]CCQ90982.1 Protein-export membrane protein SecD [Nitrospina gracilis 3/211]